MIPRKVENTTLQCSAILSNQRLSTRNGLKCLRTQDIKSCGRQPRNEGIIVNKKTHPYSGLAHQMCVCVCVDVSFPVVIRSKHFGIAPQVVNILEVGLNYCLQKKHVEEYSC